MDMDINILEEYMNIDIDEFARYIYENIPLQRLEQLMNVDVFRYHIDKSTQYLIFTAYRIGNIPSKFASYIRGLLQSMINEYATHEDYMNLITVFEEWSIYLTRYDIIIMENELYCILLSSNTHMNKADIDVIIRDESLPITTYPLIH